MKTLGNAYLIKERSEERIFDAFKKKVSNATALVLSREPPSNVRRNLGRDDIRCLWLTNINVDYEHLRPQDLEQLSYTVERFITQNKKTAVLITGIEFIISHTSFDQTMHMLQAIRDIALINDCTLIISIGDGTLDKKEENLFEQELEMIKA